MLASFLGSPRAHCKRWKARQGLGMRLLKCMLMLLSNPCSQAPLVQVASNISVVLVKCLGF